MGERTTLHRWAGIVVGALLLSAGCVAAGTWQWHRHAERSAAVALVQRNHDAVPVPIADVVPEPGAALPGSEVWRPVTVSGTYLEGSTVLLRNRPVQGQHGFHALTPLVVEGGALAGSVLVVDRGWVPGGADGSSVDRVPEPPVGPVELLVRLRADEPPSDRAAPPGQVQAISTADVRDAAGWGDEPGGSPGGASSTGSDATPDGWPTGATLGAYGTLVTEDGARPAGLGRLPEPTLDPGPHLSYAFQWWVFAAGVLVGAGVLIAREARDERDGEDDDGRGAGATVAAETRRTARRRRPTGEEEEDAILDRQLGARP